MPALRLSPASMIGPLMMVSGMSFLRWTGGRLPGERELARTGMCIDRVCDTHLCAFGLVAVGVFLPDRIKMGDCLLQSIIDALERNLSHPLAFGRIEAVKRHPPLGRAFELPEHKQGDGHGGHSN